MNIRWVRSNEILLSLFTISLVTVGALAALVAHQQHDQSLVHEQVYLKATPAADTTLKENAQVPANISINSHAETNPNLGLQGSAVVNPPSTVSLRPKTGPQRRAHPLPALRRPAPTQPTTPQPVADPVTPASMPDRVPTPGKANAPSQSEMSIGSSGIGNATPQEPSSPSNTPAKATAPDPAGKPASHSISKAPDTSAPSAPTPTKS